MIRKDNPRVRPRPLPTEYGVYVNPGDFFLSFVIGILASVLLNAITRR